MQATATEFNPATNDARLDEGLIQEMADELLMDTYVLGDQRAFRVLFERHAPGLFRMVRRRVSSEDAARDIVQQVFFNVHRSRHGFRSGSRFKPWIYTIATNQVREHYRKLGRRKEASLEAYEKGGPVPDPATPFRDFHVADTVRKAVDSLIDSQRQVLQLRWFEHKSYGEISELLGASEAAIRVRAHRGYQQLRGLLAAEA